MTRTNYLSSYSTPTSTKKHEESWGASAEEGGTFRAGWGSSTTSRAQFLSTCSNLSSFGALLLDRSESSFIWVRMVIFKLLHGKSFLMKLEQGGSRCIFFIRTAAFFWHFFFYIMSRGLWKITSRSRNLSTRAQALFLLLAGSSTLWAIEEALFLLSFLGW